MRFVKFTLFSMLLLAIATTSFAFTSALEEGCEKVLTPFRAVSQDGGHDDGYLARACPDEDIVTSRFTINIKEPDHTANAGGNADPNSCPWPLYLYAHINSGGFSQMLGVSDPITFTDYIDHIGYQYARPEVSFSFTAYEDLICTGGLQNVNKTVRFVLAYYHNGSYHELLPCPDLFPIIDFPDQQLYDTGLVEVDCGCNDTPEPMNPGDKEPKGGGGGGTHPQAPQGKNLTAQQPNYFGHHTSNAGPALVYPNPFQDIFHVQLHSSKEQNVVISVFDTQGRMLTRESVKAPQGSYEHTLSTNALPDGVYWIQIQTDDELRSFKTLKM